MTNPFQRPGMTTFVTLTGVAYDQPVLINPNYVVAVEGSYIHLFGAGITVQEKHEEIVRLFAEALGYKEADDAR